MRSLFKPLMVAAFVAAGTFGLSAAEARPGGGGVSHAGGYHGGSSFGGSYHGGYHGGYRGGYYGGGYYRGGRYWGPGPWVTGIGIGLGVGAIGYYGGYYGNYYGPYNEAYYDSYAPAPAYVVSSPAPMVVDPSSNERVVRSGQAVPSGNSRAAEPIFYGRSGQSAAKTESDRQECNRWASSQQGALNDASIFQRATFACMEGRGYTVK